MIWPDPHRTDSKGSFCIGSCQVRTAPRNPVESPRSMSNAMVILPEVISARMRSPGTVGGEGAVVRRPSTKSIPASLPSRIIPPSLHTGGLQANSGGGRWAWLRRRAGSRPAAPWRAITGRANRACPKNRHPEAAAVSLLLLPMRRLPPRGPLVFASGGL